LNFMRFLDRYAGKFIISVLVIINFILGFFSLKRRKNPYPEKVETILISKYFGLGSIMNSFPLLNVLKNHFIHPYMIFITFERNREIFDITGIVDEVITIRNYSFIRFVLDSLKAILRLNRIGIDISIDLEFFSKFSMIMSYFSGAHVRVGFFSYFNNRSALLTHSAAFNHYKHISRAYLSMGEKIGLKVPESGYSISLPKQDGQVIKELNEIIENYTHLPIVTINPNASTLCEMRKWPDDRYVELLDRLMEKYPEYLYVLIGSKAEFDYVESIYGHCRFHDGRLRNIAGKTDLKHLLALLDESELLISNDSGPVHLAAGYQIKTVVLFGPETPVLYRPLNDNVKVIFRDIYCSPCINVLDNKSFEECNDVKCLKKISVDEVFEAAECFLGNRAGYRERTHA
ncbi:MAG TPA: glycosyltransferase family 9 protein, partial [Desulfatiglandales bacterium]|nr:glycosyltransferase family 9 protein [Desulfatiglandales bacterium]